MAFSSDGTRIASVSYDRTLRLWDTATGEIVLSFQAHQDYPFCVHFSPDGTWIATGEKSIRLWEATSPTLAIARQRHLRVTAEALVDRLFRDRGEAHAVIAYIEDGAELEPDLRQLALQIARFRAPAHVNGG